MEIFFITGFFLCTIASIIVWNVRLGRIENNQDNFLEVLKKSCELLEHHHNLLKAISGTQQKNNEFIANVCIELEAMDQNLNRSLLTLREDLQSTKPIKPNNWNSVGKAFKRPSRVNIDERD